MAERRLRRGAGPVLVFAVGFSLSSYHVSHAAAENESLGTFVSGILAPLLASLSVVYAAVWLARSDLSGDRPLRVGGWSLAGAVALGSGSVLAVAYQAAHGVVMQDPSAVILGSASFGAPAGFVLGMYDARERRARERVEDSNARLTVMQRVLRHDIRNKATVIQARTAMLAEAADGGQDHARTVTEKTEELASISHQASDLDRIIGPTEVERERLDAVDAVETALDAVRSDYPRARIDGPDPGACPVRAHPLVDSAVSELVENTVVHGDARTAEVDVAVETTGDRAVVRVADDGPGIPDSAVETIERGYETSLDHNTGLGLWLVRWVTDASEGTVEFATDDSGGTVVSLSLERAVPRQREPEPVAQQSPAAADD